MTQMHPYEMKIEYRCACGFEWGAKYLDGYERPAEQAAGKECPKCHAIQSRAGSDDAQVGGVESQKPVSEEDQRGEHSEE